MNDGSNSLSIVRLVKPNTLKKVRYLLTCCLLFSIQLQAQNSTAKKENYSIVPVWINMMDDPNTNYYEAMKAYYEYWKVHAKPAGEEEEMTEGKKDFNEMEKETKREIKKEKNKKLSEDDLKRMNENETMKYQIKRFEQWRRDVKPFVQDDGSILTDEERMNIWKKQQEEMKQQKK